MISYVNVVSPLSKHLIVQACLALLLFALLHFVENCVFYKLKVFGNPALNEIYRAIFPKTFMSVSHFGNSQNISNFFMIIVICLSVISDL